MPDLNNILHSLKSHSVQPPDDQFAFILKKIKEEPSTELHTSSLEMEQLAHLRSAEFTPPSFLLNNILAAVKETQPSVPVVNMPRYYITRIAAAILVLAAAWSIYHFTTKTSIDSDKLSTLPSLDEKAPMVSNKPATDSVQPATAAKTSAPRNTEHKKWNSHGSVYTASVDGYDFPVTNNDLLFSFASLNTSNLPDFLTMDAKGPVEVRIDQSTSITVSEGMVSMMKTMYSTKRNGKPTGRAKRTKKRLEKWKNSDAKFFDKNPGKNPMDPIDLAEFIF